MNINKENDEGGSPMHPANISNVKYQMEVIRARLARFVLLRQKHQSINHDRG